MHILPVIWIVITLALIGLVIVGWMAIRKRRSDRLQRRFGREYDHVVRQFGDRAQAESALEDREKRVAGLRIRPLAPEEQTRFSRAWQSAQARFVDDPRRATADADQLVADTMRARGYPIDDFEHRLEDVSVDHPQVIHHYRAAYEIAGRSRRGEATTEDLRKAFVHYRALFDELLGVNDDVIRRTA